MDQAGLKCCVWGHVEQLTTVNWAKLNFILFGGILSWWEYDRKPFHSMAMDTDIFYGRSNPAIIVCVLSVKHSIALKKQPAEFPYG